MNIQEKLADIVFSINDTVEIKNGNNEFGQPTMIGKIGTITSFGTKYKVKGKDTIEVYVNFEHFGLHIFNDYHLKLLGNE